MKAKLIDKSSHSVTIELRDDDGRFKTNITLDFDFMPYIEEFEFKDEVHEIEIDHDGIWVDRKKITN